MTLVGTLVGAVIEVGNLVVESRDFHWATGADDDVRMLGIALHAPPDDVAMVAALLRTHVLIPVLLTDSARIETYKGIVLAVAVVLHGAAAEVADIGVCLSEAPRHAHCIHVPALVVLVGIEGFADDELAIRRKGVGHNELGIGGLALVSHCHLLALVVKFAAVHGGLVPVGVAPVGEVALHACAIVVVGGSTPEGGFHAEAVFKNGLAVDVEVVDVACPLAPCDAGAGSREGEPCESLVLGDG